MTPGTKLGPYEIISPLGKGGMGEVYRARDAKLGRDVAVKVLPAAMAQNPDRLARFEREAKVLAALNHPNIAVIYGLEETSGSARAIVMEVVEGPTLADRIAAGAILLDESLKIAAQIADALEAAHEKGIVHRDLKPANVKVRDDGTVKVLDFGLATAVLPEGRSAGENSPTLTIGATEAGVILGTAAYMSPEQAAGRPVDRRADIWAFGVVLWEMLTGGRLFHSGSVPHTLADVLRAEIDFEKLNAIPAPIQELMKRCLDREMKTRLRDIGEARIAIQRYLASPAPVLPQAEAYATKTPWVAWTLAGVGIAAAAALAFLYLHQPAPEAQVSRFAIPAPEGTTFGFSAGSDSRAPVAVSPDGRRLVFGAGSADGKSQLWVRSLDALASRSLTGTEGATFPFWSADSKFIGFFADGKLKKIEATGGPVFTLCPASAGRGGTWNRENVIVFARENTGVLYRVSAAGGAAAAVTALDQSRMGISDRWPWFLPDGKHFLYVEQSESQGREAGAAIRVGSLKSDNAAGLAPSKVVLENPFNVIYSLGHLLFLREGTLMAQPFDLKSLATAGDAVPVAEQVQNVALRLGVYSVSENGLLVFRAAAQELGQQLVWFDRFGKPQGKLGDPGILGDLHLSPDGKSASLSIVDPAASNQDIWIYDVVRGIKTRFSFHAAQERATAWSPDSRTLVFNSNRKGHFDLFRRAASGEEVEQLLYEDGLEKFPESFSTDGKLLLYESRGDPKTKDDLWVLPISGGKAGKPVAFEQTPFNEREGRFSPDGSWIAYISDESSQRTEVYLAPYPGPGGKRQISPAGGARPVWSHDGKEIFYIADGMLMTAEVKIAGSVVNVGTVRALFALPATFSGSSYDVSADGKQFLVRTLPQQTSDAPMTLVENWVAGLKK